MRIQQGAERRCADAWHVAVEDEDVARKAGERRGGAGDGVARTALFGLEDDTEIRKSGARCRGAHRIRLVPDHEPHALGGERGDRVERIADERPPAELVQHLRPVRAHARPEPRGQHDGAQRTSGRH